MFVKINNIFRKVIIFSLLVLTAVTVVFVSQSRGALKTTMNAFDSEEKFLEALEDDYMTKYGISEFVANKIKIDIQADLDSDEIGEYIIHLNADPVGITNMVNVNGYELRTEFTDEEINQVIETFKADLEDLEDVEYEIITEFKNTAVAVVLNIPANDLFTVAEIPSVQGVYENLEVTVAEYEGPKLGTPVETINDFDQAFYMGHADAKYQLENLHNQTLNDGNALKGDGVNVVVMDTGIDYYHPEFYTDGNPFLADGVTYKLTYNDTDGTFSCADDTCIFKGGYDFIDDDPNPMEATYADWLARVEVEGSTVLPEFGYYTTHGTHVSGTICGSGKNWQFQEMYQDELGNPIDDSFGGFSGIAPEVNLYVFRVLGEYGRGNTTAIMNGLESVVDFAINGEQIKIDLANLSLGYGMTSSLNFANIAAENASRKGVLIVAAAGNAGPIESSTGSPGNGIYSLSVGAHDSVRYVNTYQTSVVPGETLEFIELGRSIEEFIYDDETGLLDAQNMVYVGYGRDYDFFDTQGNPEMDILRAVTGNPNPVWDSEKERVEEDSILQDTIIVMTRGFDEWGVKAKRAIAFGASAVVFVNENPNKDDYRYDPNEPLEPELFYREFYFDILSVQTSETEGNLLIQHIVNNGTFIKEGTDGRQITSISIGADIFEESTPMIYSHQDKMAAFSSRGPSTDLIDIKPNVIAPGTLILSSISSDAYNVGGRKYVLDEQGEIVTDPVTGDPLYDVTNYSLAYERQGGTSMAAPQVTGFVALLIQRSRDLGYNFDAITLRNIVMTASDESLYSIANYCDPDTEMTVTDGVPVCKDAYNPFEAGPGMLDPYQLLGYNDTSGLLDDEYLAFNSIIMTTSRLKSIDDDTDYYNPIEYDVDRYGGSFTFGEVFSRDGVEAANEEIKMTIENNTDAPIEYELNYYFVHTKENYEQFQSQQEDDFSEYRTTSLSPIGEDGLVDARITFKTRHGEDIPMGSTVTVYPGNLMEVYVTLDVEADADTGLYSGYVEVNAVNENTVEQEYRLPFGFKFRKRDLEFIENLNPIYSLNMPKFMPASMGTALHDVPAEHMYTFIQDETGQYIGFLDKWNVNQVRGTEFQMFTHTGGGYRKFLEPMPANTEIDVLMNARFDLTNSEVPGGLYFITYVVPESEEFTEEDETADPNVYHTARSWIYVEKESGQITVDEYTFDPNTGTCSEPTIEEEDHCIGIGETWTPDHREWYPVEDSIYELTDNTVAYDEMFFRGTIYTSSVDRITNYLLMDTNTQVEINGEMVDMEDTYMYQLLSENRNQILYWANRNNEYKLFDQTFNWIDFQIDGWPYGEIPLKKSAQKDIVDCTQEEIEFGLDVCYEVYTGPVDFEFEINSDDFDAIGQGFWLYLISMTPGSGRGFEDENLSLFFAPEDEAYITVINNGNPVVSLENPDVGVSVFMHNLQEGKNEPDYISIDMWIPAGYEYRGIEMSEDLKNYCIGEGTVDEPDFDCELELYEIEDYSVDMTRSAKFRLSIDDPNFDPSNIGYSKKGLTTKRFGTSGFEYYVDGEWISEADFDTRKANGENVEKIHLFDVRLEMMKEGYKENAIYLATWADYRNAGKAYEIMANAWIPGNRFVQQVNLTNTIYGTIIVSPWIINIDYDKIFDMEIYFLHPDWENPNFEADNPGHQKVYVAKKTSANGFESDELPYVDGEYIMVYDASLYTAGYNYYPLLPRYIDHDNDPSTPDVLNGNSNWFYGFGRMYAGDFDNNEIIDMRDIMLLETCIGNEGKVHEDLDFDKDGKITEYDLEVVLLNYGKYSLYIDNDDVVIPERVDSYMGHTPMSIAYKYNLIHIIEQLEDVLDEVEEKDALKELTENE